MIIRLTISFLIFLLVRVPANILAVPCLAIALKTKWDGRTWFFGNAKWGRATDHYLAPTNGDYWKELLWMAWRNPTYNLGMRTLSVKMRDHVTFGNRDIGDKIAGGFYRIRMGFFWEYYFILPYTLFGKRCVRLRFGWKINGNNNPLAEWVFSFNPWKKYEGA